MKVLDLFSGIGGFSLGLERAGMQTIAFCEINKYCQKVLQKHWPNTPVYNDVRKLHGEQVGTVDLICGGYPCQPFSLAGKRQGERDDRHLWPEYLRLIRELRPRWVVGENVAGHITMGIDQVLFDLEREGYTWESFIIPALAIDAQHRRDRVWIVANTGSGRLQRTTLEGIDQFQKKNESFTRCPINRRNTETWRPWPTEPGVGRVVDGIPNRVDRIRGLGNAVVPQIVEIIGRAIMVIDKETPFD